MTVLKLTFYPDNILREDNKIIEKFDSNLHKFLDDMTETMYKKNGYGLAAPQVGKNVRITVIDVSEERNQILELINPVIIEQSGKIESEEGCLSIPDYREIIKRSATVTVKAQNRYGEEFTTTGEELLSRCLQHEIDHLNGILFIDHLSRLKKPFFKKWYENNKPLGEDD